MMLIFTVSLSYGNVELLWLIDVIYFPNSYVSLIPVMIVRALYGLKSSGARWRDHMAATIREAGFFNCLADPDVWMRPAVKPTGDEYYEYILCYVDDLSFLMMHKRL
jgi:hypothetical protein